MDRESPLRLSGGRDFMKTIADELSSEEEYEENDEEQSDDSEIEFLGKYNRSEDFSPTILAQMQKEVDAERIELAKNGARAGNKTMQDIPKKIYGVQSNINIFEGNATESQINNIEAQDNVANATKEKYEVERINMRLAPYNDVDGISFRPCNPESDSEPSSPIQPRCPTLSPAAAPLSSTTNSRDSSNAMTPPPAKAKLDSYLDEGMLEVEILRTLASNNTSIIANAARTPQYRKSLDTITEFDPEYTEANEPESAEEDIERAEDNLTKFIAHASERADPLFDNQLQYYKANKIDLFSSSRKRKSHSLPPFIAQTKRLKRESPQKLRICEKAKPSGPTSTNLPMNAPQGAAEPWNGFDIETTKECMRLCLPKEFQDFEIEDMAAVKLMRHIYAQTFELTYNAMLISKSRPNMFGNVFLTREYFERAHKDIIESDYVLFSE